MARPKRNHNGVLNPNWKGGQSKHSLGYNRIWNPDHARADSGGYVLEHILIAEQVLQKSLPEKAVMHHHTNNQLVICENQEYHMLLHRRKRAYDSCGNANWRKCVHCKKWDSPENLSICGNTVYHKRCERLHCRKRSQNAKDRL